MEECLLFSAGVQGSHWAARALHPAGGNVGRLQLVSTVSRELAVSWLTLGCGQPPPELVCPVLGAAVLCAGTAALRHALNTRAAVSCLSHVAAVSAALAEPSAVLGALQS